MTGSLTSVHVAGGLLPTDVLSAALAGSLGGLKPNDYHLGGENPREASARVWTHLLGVYRRFRDDLAKLPDNDPAVGVTRERWLTVLLSDLGYGRVSATGPGGLTVEDRQYPVSHLWGATPIHLLGWGVPLDKRSPGVPGAAHRAPHAMVQELLNRSDQHLWALLSNGRALRLLRDSTTLTGQAYVEFDLEAMFDGELFAEFAMLYLLTHQSRVEVPEDGQPSDCWLEQWRTTAVSQGVRALNLLRDGVQQALETLGTGFLQHPANSRLRDDLDGGAIRVEDLHASLLRTVYRLLFWSVAEDRDALHNRTATADMRERYRDHFSSTRLRRLALRRQGSAHHDLWDAVSLVMTALGREDGEPRLGLPGLGGLFSTTSADVLTGARLGNQPLLGAVRSLSIVQPKNQPRRLVDFRNLGADELGSIYESLLELVPRHDPIRHRFSLENLAGNDRKTSGSYYTPSDLVELVLDNALNPVLDNAEKQPDPEQALLALTVCDPAIGSGHFMVSAARRIAARLATVRSGEIDPTPTDTQDAMHDVVARCIYGVDINPMAADLAKVSLWLEAMSPGRPLSFLDHHIKVGNSLLGTTPALLHAGIPDEAYVALTGDDKKIAAAWKNLNEKQRAGQTLLFDEGGLELGNVEQRKAAEEIGARAAAAQTLADVAWAAQRYAQETSSDHAVRGRRVADAWCAAFLGPKTPDAAPITQAVLEEIGAGTNDLQMLSIVDHIDTLASRHRLFHWHLEFPEVFRVPEHGPANTPTGWTGGFSAMLGNPPWETLQMSEKEFFASRDSTVADAKTAALRKKLIAALAESNPALFAEFSFESRRGEAEVHLIRASRRFPLCATGKINTYSVFAEHFRAGVAFGGRVGILTPTGLATGDATSAFFSDTVRAGRLAAFYDFANHKRNIFPGLKGQSWFALTVLTGGERVTELHVAFDLSWPDEVPARRFVLALDEITLLNPNTGTLPVFRTRRDADITLACYRTHPVLQRDEAADGNLWGLQFKQGLFNMASSSENFETADDLDRLGATFDGWAWRKGGARWLPLYEAKMLNLYHDRFGTYQGYDIRDGVGVRAIPTPSDECLDDPDFEPLARYWVAEQTVDESVPAGWTHDWFFGWRDITNVTNVRTFVASLVPKAAIGHVFPVALLRDHTRVPLLQAVWSSMVMDYVVRQKLSGTHMTYGVVNQLACPSPAAFDEQPSWCGTSLGAFVRLRVLELSYTSHLIKPYAVDVFGSDHGAPYRWIPERRDELRAELDGAMFFLYGLDRVDVEHVLDSFYGVRKNEERDLGEFRTKRLVLAAYDAMTTAAETGVPFVSPMDPPPGEGPRHEERTP